MGVAGDDRLGFDENRNVLTETLGRLVPQSVARRALTVDVETGRAVYAPDDAIAFRVTFENRLPLPVVVETPGSFAFRGGERRVVSRTWHGRVRRVNEGEPTRWVDLDPGRHELGVFLAYEGGARATTTFEVRG